MCCCRPSSHYYIFTRPASPIVAFFRQSLIQTEITLTLQMQIQAVIENDSIFEEQKGESIPMRFIQSSHPLQSIIINQLKANTKLYYIRTFSKAVIGDVDRFLHIGKYTEDTLCIL